MLIAESTKILNLSQITNCYYETALLFMPSFSKFVV